MSIQNHLTTILGKAGEMRSRANQQIELAEATDARIKAGTLTTVEIDLLTGRFEGLLGEHEYCAESFQNMDGYASDIEIVLGI